MLQLNVLSSDGTLEDGEGLELHGKLSVELHL